MEQIKENNIRFFALLGVLLVSVASFLIINNYVLADEGGSSDSEYSDEYKDKDCESKNKEASI